MIYEFYCKNCKLKYEEIKEMGNYDSYCPKCRKKAKHIFSVFNSNFSAWSDTMKRELEWATTPEPDTI